MRRDDDQLWSRVKRSVVPLGARGRMPVTPQKLPAGSKTNGPVAAFPQGSPFAAAAPKPKPRSTTTVAAPLPDVEPDPVSALERWWVETGGGERLNGASSRAPGSSPPRTGAKAEAIAAPPEKAAKPRNGAGALPGALDRPTTRKIAKRRLPLDGRIDLHGLTEAEAHGRLLGYLGRAREAGLRHVIVITGKSRPRSNADPLDERPRGVLRRAVPRWFRTEPFARLVSGHSPAGPRDGGDGALYVKLKRVR